MDSHARNNTQGIQAATSAQPVTVKRGGRALLHNHSTGTAVSVTSIASADIEEGGSISLDNDTAAIAATNIAGRATVRGDLSLNNSTIFQGLEIRERGVFLSGMRGGRIGEPGTNPPRLASLTFDPTAVYRPTIGLGMQPVLVAGPVSLNGVALRVLEQGVAPRGQYVFLAAVKAHGRIQGNFVLPPGDRYSVAIDQSDLILDRAILTVNTLAQE